MKPFDVVKLINAKTEHDRDDVVRDYNPYIINRAFSNTIDTVLLAAMMTKNSHLPKDIQFDLYWYGVPKAKRYGKWYSEDTTEESLINTLCEKLDINTSLAKRYLAMLSDEQKIEILKMEGGNYGRTNNRSPG